MEETWITVGNYGRQYEAEIARLKLESAGISVFFLDKGNAMRLGQFYDGLEGVDLQVPESSIVKARAILATISLTTPETEFVVKKCSRCGSGDTKSFLEKPGCLMAIFQGYPPLPPMKKYKCYVCSHIWNAH